MKPLHFMEIILFSSGQHLRICFDLAGHYGKTIFATLPP